MDLVIHVPVSSTSHIPTICSSVHNDNRIVILLATSESGCALVIRYKRGASGIGERKVIYCRHLTCTNSRISHRSVGTAAPVYISIYKHLPFIIILGVLYLTPTA